MFSQIKHYFTIRDDTESVIRAGRALVSIQNAIHDMKTLKNITCMDVLIYIFSEFTSINLRCISGQIHLKENVIRITSISSKDAI